MTGKDPFQQNDDVPRETLSVPEGFRATITHGEAHVESTDLSATTEVAEGVWTDVRAGQRSAEGVVTKPEWPGLMFLESDPEVCVVWHLSPKVYVCGVTKVKPEQVIFEEGSNSPWCAKCLSKKKAMAKRAKLRGRKHRNAVNKYRIDQAIAQAGTLQAISKAAVSKALDGKKRDTESAGAQGDSSEVVWRESDGGEK